MWSDCAASVCACLFELLGLCRCIVFFFNCRFPDPFLTAHNVEGNPVLSTKSHFVCSLTPRQLVVGRQTLQLAFPSCSQRAQNEFQSESPGADSRTTNAYFVYGTLCAPLARGFRYNLGGVRDSVGVRVSFSSK